MNISNIKPDMTVLIHPASYKKHKRELDKIGCRVIIANFVQRDKIKEWNSEVRICQR